jgi:hypothetical protein
VCVCEYSYCADARTVTRSIPCARTPSTPLEYAEHPRVGNRSTRRCEFPLSTHLRQHVQARALGAARPISARSVPRSCRVILGWYSGVHWGTVSNLLEYP